MGLDKGTSNYTILTNYNSQQLWYDLIQNLAAIYFVWEYYNLDSIKEYNNQCPDSVCIELYKVLKYINITITPTYYIYYLRYYIIYKQLTRLYITIKPTTQDYKDAI